MMVLRKLAVALLSVGVMLPGLGHALAVKDVQTKSALGEPFQAEVELAELGDLNADEIRVSLATQEDFERLGIERVYFLTDLQFNVVVNQGGRSFISITTAKPVREPYLDFVVRIAWPGNTRLQEVTALLDPPVVADAAVPELNQAVSSAPAATTPVTPAPEAAPVTEAPVAAQELPPQPVVAVPAPEKKSSPAKPAKAEPAPASTESPDSYRTQSGDTMSKIAQQFRPDSASTAQTMVAIQRANPRAFSGDNINQLKRGQVLRIPSESEIRSVSSQEALASVREQTEAWRGGVAATPVVKPALESQQVNATAKAETPVAAAPAASKPEMKLLGAQTGKAGTAAAGKEQGAAAKPGDTRKLDENKAKAEAAKNEKTKLAGSVSNLDSQVKANDKQIEVQNAKLAELQAKLKEEEAKKAEAAKAAAAAPAVAEAARPADGAAPAPVADANGVQTQAAETSPAVEAKPLPPKKPVVVVEEPPVEEGLPLPLIGGAVGVLALLGGLFVWNKKRVKDKEEEAAALAELEAMDATDTTSGGADSLFLGGGNDGSLGFDAAPQGDDSWLGESVPAASAPAQDRVLADPLEEVEQYLAYERYPQAAGLLNKAISAHPDRADLRLKLLEVYARLDDYNGFVEQEAWFENAGDLQALAHAEELKSQLTPPKRAVSRDDPLHYERPVAAAAAVSAVDDLPSLEDLEMDFNATVSASSPALQAVKDSDLDLPSLDDDFSLDTAASAPAGKAADSGLSLDEELDFSYTEPASKPAASAAADDLSFELDDNFDSKFDDSQFSSKADSLELSSSAADESLDFSLEDELAAVAEPSAATGKMSLGDLADFDSAPELKAPEVVTTDDDLSFSLDDLEANSGTLETAATDLDGDFSLDDGKGADLSFDDTLTADSGLNDVAADFDATLRAEAAAPAVSKPAAAPVAAPVADADLGMDDEFDFLADTDENATKLDLARAYIDMGDMEGARDILQEVLTEGSNVQKDEAKGLLAQVG
ncbi:MAG TPA: FimV/HubP family polar landmark protein [Moraxellaceae bacterium]